MLPSVSWRLSEQATHHSQFYTRECDQVIGICLGHWMKEETVSACFQPLHPWAQAGGFNISWVRRSVNLGRTVFSPLHSLIFTFGHKLPLSLILPAVYSEACLPHR